MKIFYVLFLILFFYSCGRNPNVAFDSAFPKKNKDLSKIIGTHLLLKGRDTFAVQISQLYDGRNLIVTEKMKDTLFLGNACKYRGIFFLTEKITDNSYRISAFKKSGNFLYGLTSLKYQSYILAEQILGGRNNNLVKYISSDSIDILLQTDKRQMKKLFSELLDGMEADTIIAENFKNTAPGNKNISKASLLEDSEESEFISKIYPNPCKDFVTVELQEKKNLFYKISDLNGRIITNGELNQNISKIETMQLPDGIYVMNIYQTDSGFSEIFKFIKSQ